MKLIFILLFSTGAFAAEPLVCTDFYKAVCEDNPIFPRLKTFINIKDQYHPVLVEKYRRLLEDPQNKAFKGLAIKAFVTIDEKILTENLAKTSENQLIPGWGEIKNADRLGLLKLVKNPAFVAATKELNDELVSRSRNPEVEEGIEKFLIPKAKSLALEKISTLPISDELKDHLKNKITTSVYDRDSCKEGKNSNFAVSMEPGAAYSSSMNLLTICNGSKVIANSAEDLMLPILHEFGHSIGPCGLQVDPNRKNKKMYNKLYRPYADKQYELSSLLRCLRTNKSVAAKLYTHNEVFTVLIPSLPAYCVDDQADESIADWFSVETMAEYLKDKDPAKALEILRNNVGLFCLNPPGPRPWFDAHPASKDRILKLIAPHPGIRKALGCTVPAEAPYCDGQGRAPAKVSKEKASKKK
jgi:hypothetical protein